MTWLAGSLFGVARWIWIVAVIAVIVITIAVLNHRTDTIAEIAQESGEVKAVVKGQETTLEQVSKANEATARVRNAGDPLKYDTCMRDSAPGYEGNCARYKPDEPLPD